jgi:hypothetical protein
VFELMERAATLPRQSGTEAFRYSIGSGRKRPHGLVSTGFPFPAAGAGARRNSDVRSGRHVPSNTVS